MFARTLLILVALPLAVTARVRADDLPLPFLHRTTNFAVEATDQAVAISIAEKAEEYRRTLALSWLGRELPAWKKPCAVRVIVSPRPPGGVTYFTYAPDADGKSRVSGIKMELFGPLEIILRGVLPHESAHAVLTTHFGRPVPRWADEGLAILCEPDDIQAATDLRLRDLVARERAMRVNRLLELTDYPADRYSVYCQGHSLARYLLTCRPQPEVVATAEVPPRQALLRFVEDGIANGWEKAAKNVYGFASIEALESSWSEWLKSDSSRYAK